MTDIQQEIAELKQRLAELERKAQTGLGWPQERDEVVVLGNHGEIIDVTYYLAGLWPECHERGLIFRTREEAERADKKRIAIAEWNRLAGDQSWVDWMDEKEKFYPCYDHNDGIWKIDYQYNLQKWPFAHHKTKADCKAAIAKMGERMSWLLY